MKRAKWPVPSFREWWMSASRASEQKAARAADAAHQKAVANVNHLRALTDDELIARAQAGRACLIRTTRWRCSAD